MEFIYLTAVADLTTTTTMWSPRVNSGTRHSTAMMSSVPATSGSTSPDTPSTTRTDGEVRMGDSSGSQGNVGRSSTTYISLVMSLILYFQLQLNH